jgi:hypothetical protein
MRKRGFGFPKNGKARGGVPAFCGETRLARRFLDRRLKPTCRAARFGIFSRGNSKI